MNNYLLLLGNNVSEVRQILNLTQEDLAIKMGISRPTIVKLEQDPSRLTKTLAFAFFVAVSYEIKIRIKNVKNLDPKDYKNPDKINNFIGAIKKSSLLPIGTLATAATFSLGGLIPGIGAIIATTSALKAFKNKKELDELKWDEEKAKKIIEEVQKKLLEDQKKIANCFQLTAFEIEQFVERIEEGEKATEVW
ncbi:MAG TPA: helix-turn-helix transcriptional regulator [Ureibacillus sp.]|nr:helix-turn-helix transcriptional regulator [Ureibacillus sp.]